MLKTILYFLLLLICTLIAYWRGQRDAYWKINRLKHEADQKMAEKIQEIHEDNEQD